MRNFAMFLAAVILIAMTSMPAWGFEALWTQTVGHDQPLSVVDPDWDMNGDGKPEVVCTTSAAQYSEERPLRVFAYDGTPIWTYCPTADDVSPGTPPSVQAYFYLFCFADVDSHPGKEAVIGWEIATGIRGFAIVSPADNEVMASVPLSVETSRDAVIACADFGGDALDEVLITFRVGGDWQIQLWGQGTPSEVEDQAPSTHGGLTAIPGPGGTQTLGLSLAFAGHVSCSVFTADGRAIRNLLNGALPAGEHTIRWDGIDDSGNPAPSGVFFAKVATSAGESTAKLVLAR